MVFKRALTRIKQQAVGLTDSAAFLVNFSSFFVVEILKATGLSLRLRISPLMPRLGALR
jgi:hypothetical protein